MHLIDTNVVSELMRPRPAPSVSAWLGEREVLAMSVISIEEVRFGLMLRRSARLEDWFRRFVRDFVQVMTVTERIAERSGELRALLRQQGQVRAQADMLIAATAAEHAAVVVTRNERDFAGCGIRVFNPFH